MTRGAGVVAVVTAVAFAGCATAAEQVQTGAIIAAGGGAVAVISLGILPESCDDYDGDCFGGIDSPGAILGIGMGVGVTVGLVGLLVVLTAEDPQEHDPVEDLQIERPIPEIEVPPESDE